MKHEIYSTNKKLLLSLAVLAGAVVLTFIGSYLHGAITNSAQQRARAYRTAIQATNDRELNYSIDTHQGKVLSQVTIEPVDLVKFDEMNKKFAYVEKIEETYTEHQREDCTYDEEGNVEECHTEYYYTWDVTDSWELEANEVMMAGRKYPKALFALATSSIDAKDIIDGETGKYVRTEAKTFIDLNWGDDEGDKRVSYRVIHLPQSGTVFLDTSEGLTAAFSGRIGLDSRTPSQMVTDAENSIRTQSTVFNVIWTILVLAELIGFGFYVWFYEYI